jgi:peptidoglycan/LPS O-acetylase OafA/YrhL
MVFIKNLERIKTCLRHKCFQICVFILLFAFFTYLLVFRPSVAWLCDAHIFGTVLFLILFIGGSYIMESTCIKNIVKRISDLSYPIFLLHHVIIYDFFNLRNPAKIGPTLAIFIAVLITVLISARCIALFTKYLLTHNSLKKKKGGVAL